MTVREALQLLIGSTEMTGILLFQILKNWLKENGTKNYFLENGLLAVNLELNTNDEKAFLDFVNSSDFQNPTIPIRQDLLKLGVAFQEDKIFLE
jgi:hypothetical protein